jgi:hypothetical protein
VSYDLHSDQQGRLPGAIDLPEQFCRWLDAAYRDCSEFFPEAFAQGCVLKEHRTSAKLGLGLCRIEWRATGQGFNVRPSFVLPYLTGLTDDVERPVFLRRFGDGGRMATAFSSGARLPGENCRRSHRPRAP